MNRIFIPNNVSVVPILLHIGDVSDDVIDSQFFTKIVNIGLFLNG